MTEEDLTYKLITGEVVKNYRGTFYFIEPGNWIDRHGYPIQKKLHREDGPALEEADGSKFWYLNGKLHREDGPAVEYPDGSKSWCLNGIRHREDGPAIEHPDGTKEWWLNGKEFTEKEFNQRVKSK